MKIFKWLWGFVPVEAQIWVALVAFALVIGGLGYVISSIDSRGYKRCESDYALAISDYKDKSRVKIIKAGRKYEAIKNEAAHAPGTDNVVGPRIEFVIDRMPEPIVDSR